MRAETYSNKTIISGSEDRAVKIWNIYTGSCLNTLFGHAGYVGCIKVLSEERIISGSTDKTLRVWNLKSKSCIAKIKKTQDHFFKQLEILVLSQEKVATCSDDIKIWNLTNLNSPRYKKMSIKDSIIISMDVL